MKVSRRQLSIAAIWVVIVVAGIVMTLQPPIPQPLTYHAFADIRGLFGVPNFWNVVSNMPFLLFGALGLREVLTGSGQGGLPTLKWIYVVFFFCIACVCFGSGYYHWQPSNDSLVWDRIPIAAGFMAFLAMVIGEHIDEHLGRGLLIPLILIGVGSVWYWHYTELQGQGDLRAYLLVQFLSLIVIAMILALFPSRLSGVGYVWAIFVCYAVAKVFEEFDKAILSLGNIISGHSLKHIVAALGMGFFVLALKRRVRKV